MYTIYADGVCIYNDVFAVGDMKVVNPKLVMEDCAAGSLTMALPPSNKAYGTIARLTTDIRVDKDGKELWSGRVLSESKDFWNNRILVCEGELAFFNDSTQPPKEYAGLSMAGCTSMPTISGPELLTPIMWISPVVMEGSARGTAVMENELPITTR